MQWNDSKSSFTFFYICFLLHNSGILQTSNVCGQPTVQPSGLHICPNDTNDKVTYTCTGIHVHEVQWIVEQYFSENDAIKYASGLLMTTEMEQQNRSGRFFSQVIKFNVTQNQRANVTISLTISTHGIENETNITCLAVTGNKKNHSSTTLYIAGSESDRMNNVKCACDFLYRCAILET